jgi:hypothetical protein
MLADICDAPDEALAYFDTAISQAREIGIRSELAEACYWCAGSLLRNDTTANKERASDFLAEACTIWEQTGMPNQVKRASRLAAAALAPALARLTFGRASDEKSSHSAKMGILAHDKLPTMI